MATETELCKMALAELKCKQISSLDDQYSAEAQYCKMFYPLARDICLGRSDWSFAREEQVPARLDKTPTRYRFAYEKPPQCVRVVALFDRATNSPTTLPWEVFGNEIHTDLPDAALQFVSKSVSPGRYSATFSNALIMTLCSFLASPLKGEALGEKISANYISKAELAINQASDEDATNGQIELGETGESWTEPFI